MTPALSVHPYFKIDPGENDAFLELLPEFAARTATEPGCRYYEFFASGDLVYCREAYDDADAFQTHLENVGDLLARAFELSKLDRIELHGPVSEVEKAEALLADLNPRCFNFVCGVPGE